MLRSQLVTSRETCSAPSQPRNADTKVAQVVLGPNSYLTTLQFFDGKGGVQTAEMETQNLLNCDTFQ